MAVETQAAEHSGASRPVAQPPSAHGRRLLIFVLSSLVICNLLPHFVFHLQQSIKEVLVNFLHFRAWTDSWLPMMQSIDYFRAHPDLPIYYAPLYDTLIYSLASLLPLWLLKHLGMGDHTMLVMLNLAALFSIIGIGVIALALGARYLKQRGLRLDWETILAVVSSLFLCYPLLKGFSIGNAQTYLSFEFALLILLWSRGREVAGGVVGAMLTLVKPQYGLLLVWMLVRRRWNAAVAFVATGAVWMLLAVAVFGLHNNLDYLKVLSSLSRKAQASSANQSMFGTLNRVIGNGENMYYTPHVYTPYIPWVYYATVGTALLLVAVVLLFPWGKLRASTADLAAMGIISVASSPMAWEHHYGIVCGVLAWVWFAYGCWQDKRPWLLGLAWLLTMNPWLMFNKLAPYHGINVLQSYIYIGALLLVAVLMILARRVTNGDPQPVP